MTALLASLLLAASPPLVQFETYTLPNGLTVILTRTTGSRPSGSISGTTWGRERDARTQRLRPPLRAPHVPGLEAPSPATSRTSSPPRGRGQHGPQRHAPKRPHQLLRDPPRRTASSWRCGWRAIGWPSCSTGSTRPSSTPRRRWSATSGARASRTRPTARREVRLVELLFPKPHPYFGAVIGSHEDLQAATLEDVKSFFRTLLRPGERLAGHRRRLRPGAGAGPGGEVLRPHPPQPEAARAHGPDPAHHPAGPRDAHRRRPAGACLRRGHRPARVERRRGSPTTWRRRSSPEERPAASTARWSSTGSWSRRWTWRPTRPPSVAPPRSG